jgi:hypothetical protein
VVVNTTMAAENPSPDGEAAIEDLKPGGYRELSFPK